MALSRIGMLAMSHFSKVVPALRALPQPVIAAVNGCAYGGGLCLSLGADGRSEYSLAWRNALRYLTDVMRAAGARASNPSNEH